MRPVEKELCQAIMNDPHAQAEIAGAADDGERTAIVIRLGELFGLPVSREAVERFFALGPDDELSDMELEMVVGGKNDGKGKHIEGHDDNWFNKMFCLEDDFLEGGSGDDTIEGFGGDDFLYGDDGDDEMDGGDGDDTLWGGYGNDFMDGGSGDDWLMSEHGNNTLDGGAGNDTVEGGSDDDSLLGGSGGDVLEAWGGDDTLEGGAGDDTLYGENIDGTCQPTNDVFVFGTDDGHDVIMDFGPREDRLLLRGVESPDDIEVDQASGSTFITYGETRIELRGVELTEDEVWKLVDSE